MPETDLPMIVGTSLQTFEYDGLGRLVRSTDGNDPEDPEDDWTVGTAWDSLGRRVEEDQNGRPVSSGWVANRRTELHYPSEERIVHYTHDGLDRVVDIQNFGAVRVGLGPFGSCPGVHDSVSLGGVLDLESYLTADLVEEGFSHVLSGSGSAIGYDTNVLSGDGSANDLFFGMAARGEGFESFLNVSLLTQPDSLGRPRSAQMTTSRVVDGQWSAEDQAFDLTANGANDLATNGANAVHEPDVPHNASPGTGIRTRDESFVYQWDGLGRLRVVRRAGAPETVVATYRYDADPSIFGGRRVEKTVSDSGSLDGTTRFYWDGARMIEETTVGDAEAPRVQAIVGQALDEVWALDIDTDADGALDTVHYLLRDTNDDTMQVYRSDGSPAELYVYDFRGRPTAVDPATLAARSGRPVSPFLFAGQYFDAETGHYSMRARHYDPGRSVFLSRDPLGFWGDPSALGNPMAYGHNDPWNRRDPTGLEPTPPTGAPVSPSDLPASARTETVTVTLPNTVLYGTRYIGAIPDYDDRTDDFQEEAAEPRKHLSAVETADIAVAAAAGTSADLLGWVRRIFDGSYARTSGSVIATDFGWHCLSPFEPGVSPAVSPANQPPPSPPAPPAPPVTGQPDLQISTLSVAPSTMVAPGSATVTYRVMNAGHARAGAFAVRSYYAPNDTISPLDFGSTSPPADNYIEVEPRITVPTGFRWDPSWQDASPGSIQIVYQFEAYLGP